MNKMIVGVSAAALAAGLGLGGAALANAETDSPTAPPSASASPQPEATTESPGRNGQGNRGWEERGPGRHSRAGGMRAMDTAELADQLGVEQSALDDALTKVMDTMRSEREPGNPPDQSAVAKALAEELGIDEAKVSEALDAMRAEHQAELQADAQLRLDEAVTDGTLTRAEADAVLKAIDEGIVGLRGAGPRR